jgi:hypothetical protein
MEKKGSNPKDNAAGGSRVDLSLWPSTATVYGALALTEGDRKYGGYNWRIAEIRASVYIAAFERHMTKWANGEWTDKKTRVPHLASCLACIALMIDATEAGRLVDDRPPAIKDITELFDWAEEVTKHLHALYPNSPGRFTEEGKNEEKPIRPSDSVYHSISSWGLFQASSGDRQWL